MHRPWRVQAAGTPWDLTKAVPQVCGADLSAGGAENSIPNGATAGSNFGIDSLNFAGWAN